MVVSQTMPVPEGDAESAAESVDEPLPVREGDTIAGRYRVERVLGQGGMGVVVAATHTLLDQRIAIKILHTAQLSNKDLVRRFLREARVVAQMKSEHVARVFDVGTLDTGAPFIAMELLVGKDLEGHLEERGSLPIGEAVDYLMQACEAVAEAHSLGIVHRDLKPANMFLTKSVDHQPLIKVLDFGLSKISMSSSLGASSENLNPKHPNNSSITRPLAIMGTPKYMSPEQLRSTKDVDERADIWSLGVILYELLVGRPPFEAETMTDLCASIIRDSPPPMMNVPQALEDIIFTCLEKKASARFEKVSALAAALVPFSTERLSFERIIRVQPIGAAKTTPNPRGAQAVIPRSGSLPRVDLAAETVHESMPPSAPASSGDTSLAAAPAAHAPSSNSLGSSIPSAATDDARKKKMTLAAIIVITSLAVAGVILIVTSSPSSSKTKPGASSSSSSSSPASAADSSFTLPSSPITAPTTTAAPPEPSETATAETSSSATPAAKPSSPVTKKPAASSSTVPTPRASSSAKAAASTNPDRFLDTR